MATVVVGLKPEEDADRILQLVREFVAQGSSVHLAAYATISTEEDVPERLAAARSWVEGIGTQFTGAGFSVTTHTDISVSPGSDLLRLADDCDADLIVIGLEKRSRVGKALLGSDAQRVLLSADRPVLCLRIA